MKFESGIAGPRAVPLEDELGGERDADSASSADAVPTSESLKSAAYAVSAYVHTCIAAMASERASAAVNRGPVEMPPLVVPK